MTCLEYAIELPVFSYETASLQHVLAIYLTDHGFYEDSKRYLMQLYKIFCKAAIMNIICLVYYLALETYCGRMESIKSLLTALKLCLVLMKTLLI